MARSRAARACWPAATPSRRWRPATTWRRRFSRTSSHDDEISQQELFGPVTCLYRATDFDEALRLANATAFGLTGAIHTFNSNRIEQFIARYRAGLVSINGPTYGAGPHMPFGGVKNSGNGFREPGTEVARRLLRVEDHRREPRSRSA